MTHSHRDIQQSPYTPRQIYDLVADVARYPEFIPWCKAARIISRESDKVFYAELAIAYKGFAERYTSRVELEPGGTEDAPHAIHVKMTEGPFRHLTNEWEIVENEHGGAEIRFDLDFAFNNKLLDALLGAFFTKAVAKMAEAFKTRADALYGSVTKA